jgi:hypothetical protein
MKVLQQLFQNQLAIFFSNLSLVIGPALKYNGITLEHTVERLHGMPCFSSKRHAALPE